MSLALIVMLPFIGALFPALLLRAGRNACATATFTFSLAAFVLLIFQAPAVLQGDTCTPVGNDCLSWGLRFLLCLMD